MRRLAGVLCTAALVASAFAAPGAAAPGPLAAARDQFTGNLEAARTAMSEAAAAFDEAFQPPDRAAEYFADRPISFAHPSPDPVSLQQPDGTAFGARIREMDVGGGVETWNTGHTVVKRPDGWWVYAVPGGDGLTASSAKVGVDAVPSGIQPHLGVVPETIWATPDDLADVRAEMFQYMAARSSAETQAAVAAGESRIFKIPVLMLATYDEFQAESTAQYFEDFLMEPSANPTGTFAELYDEMSYGKFQVDVDVFGPYDSIPSQLDPCFYGTEGSTFGGQIGLGGGGAKGMAAEAVPQADPSVDFGQYDNDSDGWVDFLILLHSGPDAAATGDGCQTWSHMFPSIVGEPAALTTDTNSEGDPVQVGIVMTIPEIDLGIGVTAHELMHGIGEPDYYATDYAASGTGDWDLGAGGSWYGDPPMSNPLHFNPMVKMNQGWAEATLVQGTALGRTLRPRETSTDLLWVPVRLEKDLRYCRLGQFGYENVTAAFQAGDECAVEGFLIEQNSRSAPGAIFDRYALSSGALIWHYDLTKWAQGGNNAPIAPMLDLLEFDRRDATQDLQMNLGRGGPLDAFFADPVGVSSATSSGEPLQPFGEPQRFTVSGAPVGPGACWVLCLPAETAGQPIPMFEVPAEAGIQVLRVTTSWEEDLNDWDVWVDRRNDAGQWEEVKDAATAANPEVITIPNPEPGDYRVRAYNFASTELSAEVLVEMFAGGGAEGGPNPALGPASTISNDFLPTGWSFTNIRPNGLDGLAVPFEHGSHTMTIDLVRHDATTSDLSADFVRPDGPVQAGREATLSTAVYQHGGAAVPPGTRVRFLEGANPKRAKLIGEQTLGSIDGFGRVDVTQAWTPSSVGRTVVTVQVVRPSGVGDQVSANDAVATPIEVWRSDARVLVVDDDDGFGAEEAYIGALQALKVPFAVTADTADAATMSRFEAVIWHNANQRFDGIMDADERQAVKDYLEGGGRLWLSGPNAPRAFDADDVRVGRVDPAFLHDYFGVAYVDSMQRGAGTAQGTGDFVGGADAYEMTTPYARTLMDYFSLTSSPKGQSVAVLTWPDIEGALVGAKLTALDFRTVITSFDLIQLVEPADRTELVGDVLRWFEVPLGGATYPKGIRHATVRTANPGNAVTIVAAVTGKTTGVTLYYRPHGSGTWTALPMSSVGGHYVAVIPAADVIRGGIDYYIEASVRRKGVTHPVTAPATPHHLATRS
ncbi:MAG: immune inhibitor A [Actinobacteria bacterium]|nr:immune inhibitor A [Actinomycetota bacterium]